MEHLNASLHYSHPPLFCPNDEDDGCYTIVVVVVVVVVVLVVVVDDEEVTRKTPKVGLAVVPTSNPKMRTFLGWWGIYVLRMNRPSLSTARRRRRCPRQKGYLRRCQLDLDRGRGGLDFDETNDEILPDRIPGLGIYS